MYPTSPTRLNDFLTSDRPNFVGTTGKVLYFHYMTSGKKYTLSTSVFYAIFLPLIPVANRYSPSGQCNPGLGLLLFLLTPVLAAMAFIFSSVARFRGNRAFTGPAVINAGVLLGAVIFLFFGWF
jgi:hypothetical protein